MLEPQRTAIGGIGRRLDSQRMDAYQYSFDNPFLCWYAALHARGQASAVPVKGGNGLDIFMGEAASSRLAIGSEVDGHSVVLGVPLAETGALRCLKWVDAAFLRRLRGGDWIVLRTDDVRTNNPASGKPCPVRLWLPVMPGLFDVWDDDDETLIRASKLNLSTIQIEKGEASLDDVTPWASMPLLWKGGWIWSA